jgi:NAD dependent epimerase/dehydratase family enzyme
MKEFAHSLGRALHRPSLVPLPALVPRLLLGEAADVVLTGQHVVPRRATESGFRFSFPEIEPALRDLVAH